MLKGKSILGLQDMSKQDIITILDETKIMKKHLLKDEKAMDTLKGKSVVTLFYENSTRTRTSFENACKFLGANVTSISVATSSVNKGESLLDTGKTLDAMRTDLVVIRHSMSGAPAYLDKNINALVVNAGDGMHEHPTQALLDMFTMREHFGKLEGLKVAIIGDIKHSRVARSNIYGLQKFDAQIKLFAPNTLLPQGIQQLAPVCESVEEAIAGSDVVMALRIQLERQQKGLFPSVGEYVKFYGITEERLKLANDNAILMHPGPVNRNVEVDSACVDGEMSKINEQVLNGLAVRMALAKLMLKGE
ncbi:MAG: aspartate carbamoyltransferase catalytic subunit [Clostridia bacterium]